MSLTLKPLKQQVMVITGASSGIGLATAKLAARKGAKLVLAARNQEVLDTVVEDIEKAGGTAISFALDVADRGQVEKLAACAIAKFGRIDTWVNDAGIGIWGRLEDIPNEDSRRMFDTNFWGVVNGSLVAIQHLKKDGGALINLGSLASDMSLPLQAMYAATKHAIKGFTDGLRQELLSEKAPVSVTLIRPTAIGTPFGEKAKNFLDLEPQLPPPLYKVDDVAMAIVFAARHARRDIYVGGGSRVMSALNQLMPAAMDRLAVKNIDAELKNEPARPRKDNLFSTASEGIEVGRDLVQKPSSSLYTRAVTHPATSLAVLAAASAGLVTLLVRGKMSPTTQQRVKHFIQAEAAPVALKYAKRYAHQGQEWAHDTALPQAKRLGRKAADQTQEFLDDKVVPAAKSWWKRRVA